jgi:hypothetical protein
MALDRASVVKKADAFVREGKLDQAAAAYRTLVDENPGDSGAANSLGDLYARLGDSARAIEQFTGLGESEWLQGFSAKAAAFYKKALKVDPDCEPALLRLGEIAASQSLRVDAARHWTRLLEQRRRRGDAAGEAEVAAWLADLDGARPTQRQVTSVGMTPRVEAPAAAEPAATEPVADAAPGLPEPPDEVPAVSAPAADSPESAAGQAGWEAALLAAPADGHSSMAVMLAAMPADPPSLIVEQFGELTESSASPPAPADAITGTEVAPEPAQVSLEAGGWVTVNGALAEFDPGEVIELGDADLVAGATAFASERTDAGQAPPDDWEVVVEIGDEIDMTGALDAVESSSVTAVPEMADAFEIVEAVDGAESTVAVGVVPPGAAFESTAPVIAASAPPAVPVESPEPEADDDAVLISELAAAAETPSLRFQAAVQLGRIFLQRGDLGRGIDWLERACGVTAPVRDHGLLARYDLADALERAGERARALDVLFDLEMDAGSYRDVSARITRLSRATGSAP